MKDRTTKTTQIRKYVRLIELWSIKQGLREGDPERQLLKLYEEFGELAEGLAKDRPIQIKDSIGDVFVVLAVLAQQYKFSLKKYEIPNDRFYTDFNRAIIGLVNDIAYIADHHRYYAALKDATDSLIDLCVVLNIDFVECVELAYNEIKGRKGVMKNGVLVKESDLHE